MRTTLTLDDDVARRIERLRKKYGSTLRDVVNRALREGLDRVTVVEGQPDDAGLAVASVDLVLIVNTFHHIEDRPAYFRRLQQALAPGARVAVIEPNEDLGGVLGLLLDEGHTSRAESVRTDMQAAGYRHAASHELLPVQVFEVFAPDPG